MTTEEQIKRALWAVSQATNVTEEDLHSRNTQRYICTARGIYFLLCRELGIHPTQYGGFIGRSRCSTLICTKVHFGYYLSKDKIEVALLDKARKIFYAE